MDASKQARKAQAVVLMGAAVLVLVVFTALWGGTGFLIAGIGLPVPLILIWAARDVLRADELSAEPVRARRAARAAPGMRLPAEQTT
jgi:hypothetical protein